ncbi:MAG: divalent metal cation transporter [Candidatus Thermoplasmatota archaeon]|nr:divalent metal cation transporter [Candidatus Thermoplasmatota archaeon]
MNQLVRRFISSVKYFGPGAILASMTIGAGNIVLAPRVGAWALPAYSALWIVTFAVVTKGLTAYMATRYSLLSGEHIMTLFARVRPRGWINIVSIIIGFALLPFMIATFLTILGNVVTSLTNVGNYLVWGVGIGLAIACLGFVGTLRVMEVVQLVCAVFLALGAVVAVFVVHPDWLQVIQGLFTVHIPQVATWVTAEDIVTVPVMLQVAAVYGTMNGVYPDFTAYIAWWRQKTKEQKIPLKSQELSGMKMDLFLSLLIVAFFTVAFMVAGTVILGQKQLVPNGVDLISTQREIYSAINPFIGVYLYPLAVLVVIGGTIYAGMDAVPRMIKSWADPLSTRVQKVSFKRFQGYIVLYLLFVSLPLMVIEKPIILMTLYLLMTGVFGMGLLGWGALWANQRHLPKDQRFGKGMVLIYLISNIVVTVFIVAILVIR